MAIKSIVSKSRYYIAGNVYYHTLNTKKVNYRAAGFGKYKKDLNETWKNMNRILGNSKVRTCSSAVIHNHISPLVIASHFNNHFASVASGGANLC